MAAGEPRSGAERPRVGRVSMPVHPCASEGSAGLVAGDTGTSIRYQGVENSATQARTPRSLGGPARLGIAHDPSGPRGEGGRGEGGGASLDQKSADWADAREIHPAPSRPTGARSLRARPGNRTRSLVTALVALGPHPARRTHGAEPSSSATLRSASARYLAPQLASTTGRCTRRGRSDPRGGSVATTAAGLRKRLSAASRPGSPSRRAGSR